MEGMNRNKQQINDTYICICFISCCTHCRRTKYCGTLRETCRKHMNDRHHPVLGCISRFSKLTNDFVHSAAASFVFFFDQHQNHHRSCAAHKFFFFRIAVNAFGWKSPNNKKLFVFFSNILFRTLRYIDAFEKVWWVSTVAVLSFLWPGPNYDKYIIVKYVYGCVIF